MSKSSKKINYLTKQVFSKFKTKKSVTLYNRIDYIPYNFLNKNIFIYNGKKFYKILVKKEYIGLKIGSFSLTRKIPVYNKKK